MYRQQETLHPLTPPFHQFGNSQLKENPEFPTRNYDFVVAFMCIELLILSFPNDVILPIVFEQEQANTVLHSKPHAFSILLSVYSHVTLSPFETQIHLWSLKNKYYLSLSCSPSLSIFLSRSLFLTSSITGRSLAVHLCQIWIANLGCWIV